MESFEGELVLTLDVDSADPERAHAAARSLAKDLRVLDIARVRFADEEGAPPVVIDGAVRMPKSGTGDSIATLIVTGVFSAAGLKAMGDVIVAAIKRSRAGSATVQRGEDKVVLTGLSGTEMKQMVDVLLGQPADDGPAALNSE